MSDTALRSGLIRLAFANPELRPTLLPLIVKHAGEMDAELEEDADPTSHDQNLPEHYYFNKGAAGKGESVEAILKQFASPASKDQNKPEHYYGLPPKGKQAASVKVAAAGGWSAVFTALDSDMPSFNTKTVTDWNKVYKRMKKEGVKDAGAAAHFYSEYRAKRMDLDGATKALAEEGVKPPSGYEAEKQ